MPHDAALTLAEAAQLHADDGDLAQADRLAERALRWADCLPACDLSVDLLCRRAEWAAQAGEAYDQRRRGAGRRFHDQAREHAIEASVRVARVADPAWAVPVLLRASDVLNRAGHADEASHLQARALRLMAGEPDHQDPHQMPGLGRLVDK